MTRQELRGNVGGCPQGLGALQYSPFAAAVSEFCTVSCVYLDSAAAEPGLHLLLIGGRDEDGGRIWQPCADPNALALNVLECQ
jgi:hypothetical protein